MHLNIHDLYTHCLYPHHAECIETQSVLIYLIGINLPGRNLPIFEKGGKFLPGNSKHGQVMERRLKKKS